MILHLLARKKKQCYTLISISLDFVNPSLEGENTNKLCKLFSSIAPINIEEESYVISLLQEFVNPH